MPPPTRVGGGIVFSGLPSVVRLSVNTNTHSAQCNISVLSRGISVQLGTNIHHVIGHCRKGFQSQRSKVKIVTRPVSTHWRRHVDRWCHINADFISYIFGYTSSQHWLYTVLCLLLCCHSDLPWFRPGFINNNNNDPICKAPECQKTSVTDWLIFDLIPGQFAYRIWSHGLSLIKGNERSLLFLTDIGVNSNKKIPFSQKA